MQAVATMKSTKISAKTEVSIHAFILLTATYVGLVLFLPPDQSSLQKYSLSVLESRLLSLTFVIPLMVVWFFALYGFLRIKAYAAMISDSPEGKALTKLSNGLMILAYNLPLSSIIAALFNYWSLRHPDMLAATTIAKNYIGVLVSVAAFVLIYNGALSLQRSLRIRQRFEHPYSLRSVGMIIVTSAVFVWLILANPLNSSNANEYAVYYLPNWLIIFTLAIPYLLSWYCGARATQWLLAYRQQVTGKIYRQPFDDLAKGIGVIVFDAVIIQFIVTLSPVLTRLNLTPLLLTIYVLVMLYVIGYGLVARGAKGLKKIEEV